MRKVSSAWRVEVGWSSGDDVGSSYASASSTDIKLNTNTCLMKPRPCRN